MNKERKRKNHNICRILIFSIIITTIVTSCKNRNSEEVELNNTFSNANMLEINSVMEGFLNTNDDKDFFRVDAIESMILDIQLSPVRGVNHALKIWKIEGGTELLKYIDDMRKSSSEKMCNLFVETGTYYITVLHGDRDEPRANTKDSYQLRVNGRFWNNEELESNDNINIANKQIIGEEILGYFSPSFNKLNYNKEFPFREEDWYYIDINLEDGNPLLLDIELSGVSEVNSTIFFYDSQQNEIAFSNINGVGKGELLRDIGIIQSGRYYIMITSNFESNTDVPYRLLIISKNYNQSLEIEPNNFPEKSNKIIKDEIIGKIFPEGDIDYFMYEGKTEPALYRIEVLPPADLDLYINIFDKNNTRLFEIDNNGRGEREIMPDAFLLDNFYIKVVSKQGAYNQNFSYKLTISTIPISDNHEKEPNDKKRLATVVKSDSIIGYISKKRDIDFYYLEYETRVKKNFTIKGIIDSELRVSITDPLGYIIKTETIKGDDSISINEMIDNRCYIIVESIIENYEVPYTISIK